MLHLILKVHSFKAKTNSLSRKMRSFRVYLKTWRKCLNPRLANTMNLFRARLTAKGCLAKLFVIIVHLHPVIIVQTYFTCTLGIRFLFEVRLQRFDVRWRDVRQRLDSRRHFAAARHFSHVTSVFINQWVRHVTDWRAAHSCALHFTAIFTAQFCITHDDVTAAAHMTWHVIAWSTCVTATWVPVTGGVVCENDVTAFWVTIRGESTMTWSPLFGFHGSSLG